MIDNVWYTYKSRIQAQTRLARNEFHSQALLVWYSLLTAALSIVAVRFPNILGPNTDVMSAIAGVAILVVSMFVTSQDLRGRSIAMRENYLALQALYNEMPHGGVPSPAQVSRYHELLQAVENHTEYDYKLFRVKSGSALTPVVGRYEMAEVYVNIACRLLILVCLYIGPVALIPLAWL